MTLFDNQFDKLYVFLMRVILSTVWVVLLILIVSLTGCTSIPGENDLKDDQMIMSSMLFTPKSATRLEEKDVTAELDEKAIKVGEKKPSDTRDNGVYAFMNTETNYSLRKPNLENARKCSLSAGLPISNESDISICTNAINNKAIGRENLVSTYLNRGMIYTKLGQLENASGDFDKAEVIADSLGDIYFSRAILESYRYNYTKMSELILKAIDNNVRDKEKAYYFLAGAYELNFEFDKAREAYQNSLELNPNSQKVEKALSRLETLWPDSQ